jgi:hypothetical protein
MQPRAQSTGSWPSFLWMAPAELQGIFIAGVIAVVVFGGMLAWGAPGWALVLPPAAFLAVTFWGWLVTYQRLQALEDMPLARVGTAAQGYARLMGRAAIFPGEPLTSPVTRQQCCWYSYRVVTYDDEGHVKSTEHEETDWSFMMNDASGECVVDPAGARIVPVRANRYRDKSQSWTEHVILPNDPISVLGEFTTSGQSVTEHDIEFRAGQLLAEWKTDMHALQRRFPPAQASGWTPVEWDSVRLAARREVEHDLARHPAQGQNRIQKPADGRPFVISAESPEELERNLQIWSWLHAFGFVLAVGVLAWVTLRYF